jgi:hypothetical protein
MLKKSKISGVEWHSARLAKFTSSDIIRLTGDGFMKYVREKAGEEITGKSAKKEIDTDATRWGSFYEAEALQKFGVKMGISFLVTQQLVCDPLSRFGCTPDGLIVIRESTDKTEYEVETVEVKCPPTFSNYIELFECETPMDLKKANPTYYWQCLDQIINCESLKHHFVAYHPDFKRGNMKILSFTPNHPSISKKGEKEFLVYQDIKYLKEAKKKAEDAFDNVRSKLMAVECV